MPKLFPEVFISNGSIALMVSRKVKKGELRKLGSRVYTTNLKEKSEALVRRHAWLIVEELFPGALIADRTALEHRPAQDGSIFIISDKKRAVLLPGLSIHPRKGHGPLPDDKPFMGRLYLASLARAYLENMRPSRARKRAVGRTLTREEIEEMLETLLRSAGIAAMQKLRDDAKEISIAIGAEKEFRALDSLIGTLLGTRSDQLIAQTALARARGEPYDPKRLDLFQKLYEALSQVVLPIRTISNASSALPFFEAYFSNFIEGTEFEVDEAAHIIFEGKIPKGRPADAHDIIGTYQLASDDREMSQTPKDADELIVLLKRRHAHLMQGRPQMRPGEFKITPNRAGSTYFVEPELVEGTLRQGFRWFRSLREPFQRAVYMMFLIAEVHPFSDGNGRCARLMMNGEFVAARQARIIIPTVFRNNYLVALKSLTHNSQPQPLIHLLDFAQTYTSRIDWSGYNQAKKMLTRTNAFKDPHQAELDGIRLILPP